MSTFSDAQLDAQTLGKFVNDAPDAANPGHAAGTVTSRTGTTMDNLRKSSAAIAISITEATDAASEANDSKIAAGISETNATTAAAAAGAAAAGVSIPLFAAAFKAALGPIASLRRFVDFEGPRVGYLGSGTISTELDSLDATPVAYTVHTTISSVPNPRPVYTTGRGFSFSSQAGFQNLTHQTIGSTANRWALFYSCDLNVALLNAAVAHKADLAGLGGVEGDVAKVIGDTVTTAAPDLLNVFDQDTASVTLVNGYYKNTNGAFPAAPFLGYLFYYRSVDKSKYFYGLINGLGQLEIGIYPGTGSTVYRAFSKGKVAFGGRLDIAVYNHRAKVMTLYMNGTRLYGRDISALPDMTDLLEELLGGSDRTGNAVLPVSNSLRHFYRGHAFVQNLPERNFLKAYEVWMERHGAPIYTRSDRLSGVIVGGQSHANGYYNISDTWVTPSGFNGSVSVPNIYDIERVSPTREAAPNLLAHVALQNNGTVPTYYDIAPFNIRASSSLGIDPISTHSPSNQGEAFVAGWLKQINAHADGAARDWIMHQFCYPGITLNQLFSEPNTYLPTEYKTANLGLFEIVAQLKAQIIHARDAARAEGQKYTCDLMLWLHGHADAKITGYTDNASYASQFLAYYDALNAWVKLVCDQTHDITVIMVAPDYSQTGLCNNTVAQCQRMLDIVTTRGVRPIYMGPSEAAWTNHIHNHPLGQRGLGEALGLFTRRILLDGERELAMRPTAHTYTVGGTTIDIDYATRAGEYARFRDTNDNNIFGRQTDSGVDTYGYGFFQKSSDVTITIANPGVISWTAHGLANGALVRFNTLGALPTGFLPGVDYYVVNSAANTFQLSLTLGGAAINTTGTQSGVHTAFDVTNKITSVVIPSSVATMTIANPGVITWVAHGLANGVKVRLSTTGSLPTGFAINTDYFIVGKTNDTFQLSLTLGGTAINTSGAQSGVHTVTVASRVRVTVALPIVAGAEIQYQGFNCRVGNLASSAAATAYYKAQDFAVLTAGSPQFKESANDNDLTIIAATSRKAL